MKARILTLMIILTIATLAGCIDTDVIDPTGTPGPTSTGMAITPETPPKTPVLQENPAGAVFEIPDAWRDPASTKMPGKGRSNYQ